MHPTSSSPTSPGADHALAIFRRAVDVVPAYTQFLSEQGFDPDEIHGVDDFTKIPTTSKSNYIAAYELKDLMLGGDVTGARIWSSSSGSSGRPTHWPRSAASLAHSVALHGRIMRQFDADKRSTLLVVCFAMGNWIGGTYTLRAAEELNQRGFPLSVIAPGVDIETVRENIATLGKHHDQVVIAGYPPFVRDVLDGADPVVLNQDLKLLLAGESIGESWRDGVLDLIGKSGRPQDICLVYGTADAGMMGHETPTSISLRRLALEHHDVDEALFGGAAASSTLVEYDPSYRYTEIDEEGHLLFTVDNTIPLIRYRINDIGRILSQHDTSRYLTELGHDLDLRTSSARAGFIVLKRRADVAMSFYAVNLYPEPIRAALSHPQLVDTITGKSVLARRPGADLRDTLELRVELRRDKTLDTRGNTACAELIRRTVVEALAASSSEYRELVQILGDRAKPKVHFCLFGSTDFQYEIKQTQVEKVGA
ncbi:hypothetical protein C7T36_13955 [Rhodococcus sp. AD45-ID]|uniref:phenylacetate--CoA ligase family protein n=1 Tax=Rhodococcus TaxID=1827 RepID=UPI0005D3FBD4|nr:MULTISPECIES: hypothetical protein [Rhodococcus]KJF24941.1 phenylacetate-CoA ligase [Rhodococcus sp. AD45]PSR43168.1 hypothetical protein C7T36_13955 [Rhodococcus sp. AD45-ID]QXW00631.1 phenylacetate--CoA ligase family protein [Rhodococcus globerulus]